MTRRRAERQRPGERGSLTLEVAVLAPGLLVLIGLLVVVGRFTVAQGSVESAARDAARTASVARTAETARTDARTTADSILSDQGLQCAAITVDVDAVGFAMPVGRPAQVRATVTCQLELSDIAVPGLPGSATITRSATSPLDTYRERGQP